MTKNNRKGYCGNFVHIVRLFQSSQKPYALDEDRYLQVLSTPYMVSEIVLSFPNHILEILSHLLPVK